MNKMTNTFIFFILVVTLCSCDERKFDRDGWINDDPVDYSNRRSMVNDILHNKILDNKEISQVTDLLGKPEWVDTAKSGVVIKMYYIVQLSYGYDIDPKFSKLLELEIDNGKIKNVKIVMGIDRRSYIEKIFTNYKIVS